MALTAFKRSMPFPTQPRLWRSDADSHHRIQTELLASSADVRGEATLMAATALKRSRWFPMQTRPRRT